MPRQLGVEFANFICKFGDKDLLDFAGEVILPAFLAKGLMRTFGETTSYFFHQTKLIEFSDNGIPVLCIAGRFIKDTNLEREQVFEQNRLIRDPQQLHSSPSSIFVLILNNHKLIYVNETVGAPNLKAFNSTISAFAKKKHFEFINKLYEEKNKVATAEDQKISKRRLVELYPYPNIEIIPLSSETSLSQFISKYQILRRVEARLVETNQELDMNHFFAAVREKKDEIGSKATTLTHYSPGGLSKEEAIHQLNAATNQGNTKIKLEGKDSQGDTLRGNNDSFKIRVPVENISANVSEAAKELLLIFERLRKNSTIKVTESTQSSNKKILDLLKQNKDA